MAKHRDRAGIGAEGLGSRVVVRCAGTHTNAVPLLEPLLERKSAERDRVQPDILGGAEKFPSSPAVTP